METGYTSRVKLDGTAKVITFVVFGLMLCMALMPVWLPLSTLWVSVICIGIMAFCVIKAPRSVTAGTDALVIHLVMGEKRIPFAEIESSRRLPNPDLSWRVWASGGVMGYYGTFRNRALGRFEAYVGVPSDSILVSLRSDENIIFSCADPDEMLRRIRAACHPHSSFSSEPTSASRR